MHTIKILILAISASVSLMAQPEAGHFYADYDENCKKIYALIIDYRLEKAEREIATYKTQNPYNLAVLHLENYSDFLKVFIKEEKEDFTRFGERKEERVHLISQQLNDSHPYKKYLLAEIYFQYGICRAKFGQTIRSANDIYYAYRLLEANKTQFPHFIYNKKSLAILHSMIGTIDMPDVLKNLFQLKGDQELAVQEIESLWRLGPEINFFYMESGAILAYINFYQGNKRSLAFKILDQGKVDPASPLFRFLICKMAMDDGKNDLALQILKEHPMSDEHSEFKYLDYMTGLCLLRKLDPECTVYFKRFVDGFRGRHYIKDCYQKLAWSHYILDKDVDAYKKYIKKANKEGFAVLEEDKQAQWEYDTENIPHPQLLKARLLFDGGYYSRADSLLSFDGGSLNKKDRIEYHYRKARIYQELSNWQEALSQFEIVMNYADRENYFSCNGILQMGMIYEERGNNDAAEKYYTECLDREPEIHRRGIHQKAKSGLQRILK